MSVRSRGRICASALTILVSGVGCSSRPPWADGAMVKVERDPDAVADHRGNLPARLLAIHNRERAEHRIRPLVWDPYLAAASSAYARQLIGLGKLQHSPPATRPGQGENLWMGTHDAYRLEEMANSWAREKQIFRPGTVPKVSASGKFSDVGHYTQMIWRGTTSVGCALEQGREWDYLVCRYAPAGNVVGQRVP